MHKKTMAAFLIVPLLVVQLFGSGFSIYEQGAKSTALSGAVIAAVDDPSAVFYNPAAITRLDGIQVSLGATVINTQYAFIGPGTVDPKLYTKAEKEQTLPSHLYVSYQFNDWLNMGFGFYSPFGTSVSWGNAQEMWAKSQLVSQYQFNTYFYNPVVAVKVLDNVSLGAGISFIQSDLQMDKNVFFAPGSVIGASSLEATGSGIGYNVGLQYKPIANFTLGVNYRSGTELDFKDGTATYRFPATGNEETDRYIANLYPASTSAGFKMKLPYQLGAGAAFRFTENLIAEFDYVQTGWSSYDKIIVSLNDAVDGNTEMVMPKNYEDSYSVRFGLEYKVDASLALRAGYYWEKHTVPAEFVEPSMPDGSRHNYTIGFGYKIFGISADGFYHISLQDDREITNSVHGFNGDYSGLATLYGLTLGYSF